MCLLFVADVSIQEANIILKEPVSIVDAPDGSLMIRFLPRNRRNHDGPPI
jgi:hypothetical protein